MDLIQPQSGSSKEPTDSYADTYKKLSDFKDKETVGGLPLFQSLMNTLKLYL